MSTLLNLTGGLIAGIAGASTYKIVTHYLEEYPEGKFSRFVEFIRDHADGLFK